MDLSLILMTQHAEVAVKRLVGIMDSGKGIEAEVICVDASGTVVKVHAVPGSIEMKACGALAEGKQYIKHALSCTEGDYVMLLDEHCVLSEDACIVLLQEMRQRQVDALQCSIEIQHEDPKLTLEGSWFTRILPWGWIYRGDMIRKAVDRLPDVNEDAFMDLLTPYVLRMCSPKWVVIEQRCLVYSARSLSESWKRSAEQWSPYQAQLNIWWTVEQIAECFRDELSCMEQGKIIRQQCIDIILWNWIQSIPSMQSGAIFDQLLSCAGKEEVLLGLNRHLEDWCVDVGKVALCLSGSATLRRKNEKIQTVGAMYYRAYNGGIERVMTELAGIWSRNGYSVVIITEQEQNELDYSYPDSVQRISLHRKEEQKANDEKRIHDMIHVLETSHVDAVVYHEWFSRNAFLDILLMKLTGKAVIVHTHGSFSHGLRDGRPDEGLLHSRLGMIYRMADAVVTLSDVDACWWRHWHGNVHKVCNPISIAFDSVRPTEVRNHDLLWIGRISPEKQPEKALEILERVRHTIPEAVLHIVGTGENDRIQAEFEALIDRMNLNKHVVLHGYQKDVLPFYEQCAVVLCTSAIEGFMLTLAESKIMSRPAVVFDLPNLDMVRQGMGMRIVPQGDVRAAAEAVVEMLTDYGLWLHLSREARESARQMCSFNYADKWKEIFQSVEAYSMLQTMENSEIMVRMLSDDLVAGYRNEKEAFHWRENRIRELEEWCVQQDEAKQWLENQVRERDKEMDRCAARIHALEEWCVQQDEAKQWLENQVRERDKEMDRRAARIHALEEWCVQQDDGKRWLEEKVTTLEKGLEEKEKVIAELHAWCDQQEQGKQWLESQVKTCNIEIEKRDAKIAELQEQYDAQVETQRWLKAKISGQRQLIEQLQNGGKK